MPRQEPADVAASADDAQESGGDERRERALVDRHEGVLRGVHLEDRDPVERDQLVQDVEEGNRSDVAGTEHQAHTAGTRRIELSESRIRACFGVRDARGQPHLGRVAREQEGIGRGEG